MRWATSIFSVHVIINSIRLATPAYDDIGRVCYNPLLRNFLGIMAHFARSFLKVVIPAFLIAGFASGASAQGDQPKPIAPKTTPTPTVRTAQKPATAEDLAELAIFFYGGGGARDRLNQIRKTTLEKGRSVFAAADGTTSAASYQRFIIRGDKLDKERIRLDQDFPSARYSLIFNDEKIYGVYNNTVFTPREDAIRTFENQIVHGLEALLRYKENESKLELQPKEKVYGVDYYVIDVTDKASRKTRFYVSAKSYRVMMLTYEEEGIKYRRKFYDYNYAQGTLVPYRTVLWADDKQVEETEIGTVTFGQKVDEDLFRAG